MILAEILELRRETARRRRVPQHKPAHQLGPWMVRHLDGRIGRAAFQTVQAAYEWLDNMPELGAGWIVVEMPSRARIADAVREVERARA